MRNMKSSSSAPAVSAVRRLRLHNVLVMAAPFIMVALWHYVRYVTLLEPGQEHAAIRAKTQHAAQFRRHMQDRMARLTKTVATSSTAGVFESATSVAELAASAASSAATAATSVVSAAADRVGRRHFQIAAGLSSEDAMKKVLAEASLSADVAEGLGEVTTAEAFHKALQPGLSVWLTFSNQAYLHFAQNWYLSIKTIGRHRQVIVAALDAPTLKVWRGLRVPVLDYSSSFGDTSDFRGIGADQARFRKMGAMKVAAFLELLELGRSVLVSDVDTVWTADPTSYFTGAPPFDVAVTSDCLSREADENKDGKNPRFHPSGVWFCGHSPGNTFGATFNTGVLYLAPTPAAKAFTARWRDLLLAPTDDWHMEDQRGFNQLVMTNFYPTVAADEAARPVSEMDMTSPTPTFPRGSVVFAANRSLLLHPLPARRFCSGHTFFVQQSGRRELCTNVHVTFCEGGIHGKLWRLIEAGMWSLHPKGYFDTGRFLTITPPAIPTPYPPARIEPYNQCQARQASGGAIDPVYHGWWSPGGAAAAAAAECKQETQQYKDKNGDMGVTITEAIAMSPRLQGHLAMADRYLLALRDGMSAAWLLQRTFVFPRFGCLCDRSEWPDIMPTCRLENSDLEFPFDCPLNFLLNVHFMQGIENGDGVRHGVPYREHSFLHNERLAPAIRSSRVNVSFYGGGLPLRSDGGGAAPPPGLVRLPRGATDREVLEALGPNSLHHETAVIALDTAEDVLGGFEDEEAGDYIRALLESKVLYGSWCCSRTNFHNPGATAFFPPPAKLPTGAAATAKRKARAW